MRGMKYGILRMRHPMMLGSGNSRNFKAKLFIIVRVCKRIVFRGLLLSANAKFSRTSATHSRSLAVPLNP